jgi:hypothetical protein
MRLMLIALLVLGACRREEPARPTAQQSAELNEAEDMLNGVAANEEGPEQSPGPSNSTD